MFLILCGDINLKEGIIMRWRLVFIVLVLLVYGWYGNIYLFIYLIMFVGFVLGFDLSGDDECGSGIFGYLVDGIFICFLLFMFVFLFL